VTPILPAALREAVARLAADIAPSDLAKSAAALSAEYRSGGASARAILSPAGIAAYLTVRQPATYAAMAAALGAVTAQRPAFVPKSVLDLGAGPGTASWAAAEFWPHLESITMLDRDPNLLAVAQDLARTSETPALNAAHRVVGDIAALDAKDAFDLVLAGYAIAELPASALARAIEAMWNACRGVLVLVEPGTPAGFTRLLECRTLLLRRDARIVAPCAGDYACPVQWPDWCHFSVRLPRSRAHMRAKNAEVPFEDERFSYLAVARETVAVTRPKARIVSEPRETKPGVVLRLCADGSITERIVPVRDRPAHKRAAKAKWGDAFDA
jgi:ribosomal protein RSM22 (predicted rRNA methylase)